MFELKIHKNRLKIFSKFLVNVIFGGGRQYFLRTTDTDYSKDEKNGTRIDDRNLINDWIQNMKRQNKSHTFVWNVNDFRNINADTVDYAFG